MSSIPTNLPLCNDLIGGESYGTPQLDVPMRLNVNENPYVLDPAVRDTIAKRVREIAPALNWYPDREHIEPRWIFSGYLARESSTRLDVDELWGANSPNETMFQLLQVFGGLGRIVFGADPAYPIYLEHARDIFAGRKLVHRNADFMLSVDKVFEAVAEVKPSTVLLTSPNNLTGTPLPMEDTEYILTACETAEVAGAGRDVRPILTIDEAYVELHKPDIPSTASLIKDHPNLAVSRTMNRTFAFTSARVGYPAASKGIIGCMRIVRMPYHLPAVTQVVVLAAFEHTDEQLSHVKCLRETRETTATRLKKQTYKDQSLEVAEPGSSFLLFNRHFDKCETIFGEFLKRGVLIRVVGPNGWLRVCMDTNGEIETFCNALIEVLHIVETA